MASNQDLRTLLLLSMGLTFFGMLFLYTSITSHQTAAVESTRRTLEKELKSLSSGVHSKSSALGEQLEMKQDRILERIADLLGKTVEVTKKSAALHEKVENIANKHETSHNELLMGQKALHDKLEVHHEETSLMQQIHAQDHSAHQKEHEKEVKKVQRWDFSNGAQLTAPWEVNGTHVFLEDRRLFSLDKEGYIRFAKGVKRVHVYVGSQLAHEYAETIKHELKADDELHIFMFAPESDGLTLPKQRCTLIPAGVHRTAGFHTTKATRYPVVRLEHLLQLMPTDIPVELIRMGPHYDFFAFLSAGAHLLDIPRLVMRLQDLPNHHTGKLGKAANTTATTSKL